ncbi:hypothetical protein LIER_17805 [Lithospermum erythrorhizon]|uniref:Uncharacterized protein n=1 Tax=Lithospermum erythrorhizon TaxID=34254 RepID=A0AAV3QEG8_LITER
MNKIAREATSPKTRREDPRDFPDDNAKNAQHAAENEMDEGSDRDAYGGKRANGRIQKQTRPKPKLKTFTSRFESFLE